MIAFRQNNVGQRLGKGEITMTRIKPLTKGTNAPTLPSRATACVDGKVGIAVGPGFTGETHFYPIAAWHCDKA